MSVREDATNPILTEKQTEACSWYVCMYVCMSVCLYVHAVMIIIGPIGLGAK